MLILIKNYYTVHTTLEYVVTRIYIIHQHNTHTQKHIISMKNPCKFRGTSQ